MSADELLRLLLIAGTAVSGALLIRGKTPALAMLISLAALTALLGRVLPQMLTLDGAFRQILLQTGLETPLFIPIVKVLGITEITHLSAELCRDSGEKAIAAKLELCGALASVLCILPLARQALELIGGLGT